MPLDSLCNYTMPSSSSMPSTSGISTSNMEKQTVDRVSTEIMTEYLRNQENLDCIVSIYHAKVAQKSYAKEKRFFCPPPCIYRKGTKGWQLRKSRLQTSFQKSNGMMNHNANSSPNDQFDLLELCCTVGITAPGDCLEKQKLAVEQEKVIVDFRGKDFCKVTLYISDSDKRKYFTLDADFFYNHTPTNNVSVLGSFSSQRIKVISKPPKKKHSIINKTNDCKYLCIPSGTKVALFNRRASQASLTKFLHVENENFNANSDKWSAFTIYLVDEKDEQTSPTSESYCVKDGYINYGSIVRLVDSASGLALPNLRICKVEKNEVLLNIENETVSQLHKCAFQMVDQRMTYLHLYNDGASTLSQIQLITAKSSNINTDTISDGAIWTIVSADTVEYKFYEALGPVQIPVTPVPVINGLNMEASESHLAYIEISGSNFLVALTVWLGSTPIETHVRSKELIRCPLPALSKLNSEWPSGRVSEDEIEFPLSLVRHDGVIYSTSFTIKYSLSNSSMGRPGGVPLNVEFEQA
ncbi:beta-trefoil DNA-binding domain-containing protein [Ditylenchus destructor]|uniref:Beta-trefoil DNA-binding domain-containing protein n=1 Tax=Ditylenchus destructor TaxID=166010 RepID=A0AAD4R125_9BILA|nr:beta-trefoil DNA-binding domain-containing protein [Ditylenchus destructor]